MDNLPSLPENRMFDMSLVHKNELILKADDNYDFEDIKIQFDEQIPFYEKTDYAVAAASGLLTAIIDIFLVGDTSLTQAHRWGKKATEDFVIKAANKVGFEGNDLKGAISFLEKKYPLAGDAAMNSFGGGLQHHLRDFSHHPTVVGLLFSLLTQFTGKAYGTDVHGVFIIVDVPAWKFIGKTVPEKIVFGTVYWMFHLISDMAGSSGSIGKNTAGTGIPGPLLSFIKEVSALPFFKNLKKDENGVIDFSKWISKLFNGTATKDGVRFDLRTELGLFYNQILHSLPVIANELIVRSYYLVSRVCVEIAEKKIKSIRQLNQIDIGRILPFRQRKLTRMLTISSGTFFVVTTTVTITKGIVTQDYAGMFINLNYAGMIRFAIAIKDDYAYICEDISAMQEAIKEREEQRYKYFAEQDIGLSYFTLDEQQSIILDSLKYQKNKYDIANSTIKKAAQKEEWLNKWVEKLPDFEKNQLITDEPTLYLAIGYALNKNNDKSWMNLVAMELSRFSPYYPWGDDKDEDKIIKSLQLKSDYDSDVFPVIQNYISRNDLKKLVDTISKYEKLLNGNTKKIITGVAATVVITATAGGIAFFAAPAIAVAIAGDSFVGLYGAALTNASLAAIGGGSLAAGGLGMAGGTAIITSGGAMLSFLGSGGISATTLKFLSSKGNVITECASILAYCDVVLSKSEEGKNAIKKIHDYLVTSQEECENDLALMKASTTQDKDKKLIKASENNLKYIKQTIKVLNKLLK